MWLIDKYYDKRYGRVLCAAIRNSKKLYRGRTHAECFVQEPKGVLRCAEQGFITERNKFVDRYVALKIARHYNQIQFKHPPKNMLYSEDLKEE